MEYSKIIAITGLPGLFELISSKSDGGIVRSLDDKSTKFVSSRVHQFSHLESIEVYTTRHNVNLVDVLKAMESSKEKLPDDKDSSALKSYFEKVYPELDFDRVYASDLKKMVKWHAVLSKNEVEIKLSEPAEEPVEEPAVEEKEEKPAKKETPAKAEKKVAEEKKPVKKVAETKAAEIKPVKKTSEKKETKETKPAKKETPKKAAPATAKKTTDKPAAKKSAAKKK
ncbi:MAG TPA: DUF5606 domain-containing protein [Puia sp.]|nr:DUF5606 domain-containing protein [Puia sp.]